MIDTHCHIHLTAKDEKEQISILNDTYQANFQAIIEVSVDFSCLKPVSILKQEKPNFVFTTVGIHPSSAHHYEKENSELDYFKRLEESIALTQPVAIGESGLDFFKQGDQYKKEQITVLIKQISLAKKHNIPIIIHCRAAIETLYEIMLSEKVDKGLLHCYSENYTWAKKFLDLGFYISFSGNVTYPEKKQIQETAKKIPEDRILIETDCPYLAPIQIGGREVRNLPKYLKYTNRFIAKLRSTTEENLDHITTNNALRCFNIHSVTK